MKESTGALIWIACIIILVVCLGVSIRTVRNGLAERSQIPKEKSLAEQQSETQKIIRDLNLQNKQQMRDLQRELRDNRRKISGR